MDCVLRECLHNNTEVNHDISQTYQCCYTYLFIVIIWSDERVDLQRRYLSSVMKTLLCVCVCEKGCLHGGQRRNRLLFGLNHHTLGDQVKCQMLFVQLVKWLEESERERERETQGQEYTDTTCHDEGQMGGSRDVIPRVKYSDWEACVTSSVACVCVFRCVWRYICSNVSLLISNNSIWRET